jgi:hypothetical protein
LGFKEKAFGLIRVPGSRFGLSLGFKEKAFRWIILGKSCDTRLPLLSIGVPGLRFGLSLEEKAFRWIRVPGLRFG